MRHASAACGLLPIQVRYVCAKVLEFQSNQRRLFAIERLISRRCIVSSLYIKIELVSSQSLC